MNDIATKTAGSAAKPVDYQREIPEIIQRMVALQESSDEGRTTPVQGGEHPPLGLTDPSQQTVLRGSRKQPIEHRFPPLGGPNIGGAVRECQGRARCRGTVLP